MRGCSILDETIALLFYTHSHEKQKVTPRSKSSPPASPPPSLSAPLMAALFLICENPKTTIKQFPSTNTTYCFRPWVCIHAHIFRSNYVFFGNWGCFPIPYLILHHFSSTQGFTFGKGLKWSENMIWGLVFFFFSFSWRRTYQSGCERKL